MFEGMFDAQLKETCLFFIPKEPKKESEIKTRLTVTGRMLNR